MKQVYSCDICKDNMEPRLLIGCKFAGMKTFTLDTARSTDGTHICFNCADQITVQFATAKAKAEAAK